MLPRVTLLLLVVTGACLGGCDLAEPDVRSACAFPGLSVTSWSRSVAVNGSTCDSQLDKAEFVDRPEVRFSAASKDAVYSLVMADPDVPGFAEGEYWLHWILSDIPGCDFATGNLDAATEVTSYNQPEPPAGSGAHRYQFFAFKQSGPQAGLGPPPQRQRFRLVDWLQEPQQEQALCGVAAGVQFRAAY